MNSIEDNKSILQLKVSGTTDPKKLAGTIKYYLSKNTENVCEISALGTNAIYKMTKSLALLNNMFKYDYVCTVSYFHDKKENNISGIMYKVTNHENCLIF